VLNGEQITYLLTAHNAGPQTATGTTVIDTLPAGVTFDSTTPSQGSCSHSSGTVTCPLGTLADQATATIQIRVHPTATGTITNQAGVASDLADPNSADNGVSAQTTVSSAAVGYARPKGATPLRVPLVTAFAECTSPNRVHGPPLGDPSCNPPALRSGYLTVGSPDANSRPANMVGSVRIGVTPGTAGGPDDADVPISASVTDVRVRTTLADYTGELQGRVVLRITDRLNGTSQADSATVSDTPFTFTLPCTVTGGTANIGSTCALSTTADAIQPGIVREIKRSVWELGELLVLDGGPDDDAETADNTVFLRQGIFVP
jgi:uncharacterized repeat protein (TIGR01451 family)